MTPKNQGALPLVVSKILKLGLQWLSISDKKIHGIIFALMALI